MFRQRSKVQKAKEQAVSAARTTNPAFPVAGAAGFALLGAALMRRMRRRSADD